MLIGEAVVPGVFSTLGRDGQTAIGSVQVQPRGQRNSAFAFRRKRIAVE